VVHLEKRVDDSIRNTKSTLFLLIASAPPDPEDDCQPGGKRQDAGQDLRSGGYSGEYLNERAEHKANDQHIGELRMAMHFPFQDPGGQEGASQYADRQRHEIKQVELLQCDQRQIIHIQHEQDVGCADARQDQRYGYDHSREDQHQKVVQIEAGAHLENSFGQIRGADAEDRPEQGDGDIDRLDLRDPYLSIERRDAPQYGPHEKEEHRLVPQCNG